ncbi:hypothetical protein [Hydrogenophaga sp. RWCD_12]
MARMRVCCWFGDSITAIGRAADTTSASKPASSKRGGTCLRQPMDFPTA